MLIGLLKILKMEIMEPIVNKILKAISLLFLLVSLPFLTKGQIKNETLARAFSYKGISKIRLTADSANRLLINDLTRNIYFSTKKPSCQFEVGLFLFKVDSKGRINKDEIIWQGKLVDSTRKDILTNILKTSGKYVKNDKKLNRKNHWYLFEYISIGYDSNCGGEEVIKAQRQLTDNNWAYYSMVKKMLENITGLKSNLTLLMDSSNAEAERRGFIKPLDYLKL